MPEYIEKEKAIKICLKHHSDSFTDIPAHEAIYALTVDINNIEPSADVVKVVRCKNCIHFVDIGNGIRYCSRFSNEDFIHFVFGDNFCSYGERRNN